MPVYRCENGKYRIGDGLCMYDSKDKAERAYKAYLAKTAGDAVAETTTTMAVAARQSKGRFPMRKKKWMRLIAEAVDSVIAGLFEAGKEKKPPLGSGERFAKLKSKLSSAGVKDPGALAAYIGRKKFGKKRFGKLSAGGKKGKE